MHPHEHLPEVMVVDPTPIPYLQLPAAGTPALERDLGAYYGAPAAQMFRLVRIATDMFYALGTTVAPLSFYEELAAGEMENGRERLEIIRRYQQAFERGDPVEPVVVTTEQGWLQLLDGHHRVAAADATGVPTVDAWEHLNPNPDPDSRGSSETRARVEQTLGHYRARLSAQEDARPKRRLMGEEERDRARRLLLGEE